MQDRILYRQPDMISEITEQSITWKLGQLSVPSRLGVKTSLGPVTALLDRLNHPERSFPSIHVGGTSGKGSTATFLANILGAAGYSVGLFTKPHLQSVRERFVVNQKPVAPEVMLSLLDRMPADLVETPTWFELMVALAFQLFADQPVDFGVIEVGLGGKLDATNVLLPALSILTNVGLDHTDILGDTVEEIARDKVGIFKSGRPVVSGVSQPSVISIVENRSDLLESPLMLLNRDFQYSQPELRTSGSVFNFAFGGFVIPRLSVKMPGLHQVVNATLAVAAALQLREAGYSIPTVAIRDGLAETRVPGRLEIFPDCPNIVLDGAHSPPKMEALIDSLRGFYPDREVVGILSLSKGHNAHDTLLSIAPLLRVAVLTEFTAETDYGNKRAQDPQEIAAIIGQLNPTTKTIIEPDPVCALDIARRLAKPDDLICVTGSIFLVGQIRKYLIPVDGGNNVSDT